jgi:hypothetical protein
MTEESKGKELQRSSQGSVPSRIELTPSTSIDISWLPEDERKELLVDHAKGILDVNRKARELQVDAAALKKILDDLAATTLDVSQSGSAVTVSHTQTTSIGRTEVIMGNTQQAQSGKLSKSQTGEKDWTPYYIFGGIVALIIIVALAT